MLSVLTVYPSRFKLMRAVGAGLLVAAFCDAVIQYHMRWHADQLWYYVAFGGIPVAILVACYWLGRLIFRHPVLTVTTEGIMDTSSPVGAGLIRWSEIAQITRTATLTRDGELVYFTIIPRDPHAISARQRTRLSKLNEWAADGAIMIGQVMLPMAVPSLLQQVEAYYQTNIAPTTSERVIFTLAAGGS